MCRRPGTGWEEARKRTVESLGIKAADHLTDGEAQKLKGIFKNDHALDAVYDFIPEDILKKYGMDMLQAYQKKKKHRP